jgi:hypothetical protein
MYRQFDGYLEGHGYELSVFLKKFFSENENIDIPFYYMECLSRNLFSYFKTSGEQYIEEVSHNVGGYWCHDYQYHIYADGKVEIVGLEKNIDVDWRTDDFEKLSQL